MADLAQICRYCRKPFRLRYPSERAFRFVCSKSCVANNQPKKFDPAPDDLRRLVWEMPSEKVAASFGVSDAALAKRCRKYGIKKPPRGYWNRLAVGKIDAAGNFTIPMIECACGCGQLVPKWSGKLLKPRRCMVGHNARHSYGGWTWKKPVLNLNEVALLDCRGAVCDDVTALVIATVQEITYANFCEYLAPVWLAIHSAWCNGERSPDAFLKIGKQAVKEYWREIRGRASRSLNDMFEVTRFEATREMKPVPFDEPYQESA